MSETPEFTITQQIKLAVSRLSEVTDVPFLEAEILLAHVMDVQRSYLYAYPHKFISVEKAKHFWSFIGRRLLREPIAYLIGNKEFWSLPLLVNSQVLIPRPETEELVDCILNLHDKKANLTLADLGTGSGAIAIALASECPHWQIYATDLQQDALIVARKNAMRLNLSNITFYQGNWCDALPDQDFDIIVSNPPYIAENEWPRYAPYLSYEPKQALVAGMSGLEDIQQIISAAKNYLKSSGCLFIEHGFLQASMVRYLFQQEQYNYCESIKDLSGKDRITWASSR